MVLLLIANVLPYTLYLRLAYCEGAIACLPGGASKGGEK
jgi:hypothetical protein